MNAPGLPSAATRHVAWQRELDGAAQQLAAALQAGGRLQLTMEVLPTLASLARRFALAEFECRLLLLAAIWPRLAASEPLVWSRVQTLFDDADPLALSPAGALRRWRLLEIGHEGPAGQMRLAIDERVRFYLEGHNFLDPRLEGLLQPVAPGSWPWHADVLAAMEAAWRGAASPASGAVLELCGGDAHKRLGCAAALAQRLQLALYVLNAHDIPQQPAEREALARLWEREAMLLGAALLIDAGEADVPAQRQLRSLLTSLEALTLIGAAAPMSWPAQARRPLQRFMLTAGDTQTTLLRWQAAWAATAGTLAPGEGPVPGPVHEALRRAASQFRLDDGAMLSAAAAARAQHEPQAAAGALWASARLHARRGMDGLAQRIDSHARWRDLVLPASAGEQLQAIAAQLRQRHRVHDDWGFGAASTRGQGIAALFCGASGTGKTLAAEVIAGELQLDLYRIDLAQVVSKFIGETEKNLERIFAAGEAGGAILLFDEADALFGKRSEVRDSHDRYANIEVSYLLQRLESYRGLAILTTNLRQAIDSAFLRRLRFVVQFPFPDEAARLRIWSQVFPSALPREELRLAQLAKLSASGGQIRNIALAAAFSAADEGRPLAMDHLKRAAEAEFAKLEKPLARGELEGWT